MAAINSSDKYSTSGILILASIFLELIRSIVFLFTVSVTFSPGLSLAGIVSSIISIFSYIVYITALILIIKHNDDVLISSSIYIYKQRVKASLLTTIALAGVSVLLSFIFSFFGIGTISIRLSAISMLFSTLGHISLGAGIFFLYKSFEYLDNNKNLHSKFLDLIKGDVILVLGAGSVQFMLALAFVFGGASVYGSPVSAFYLFISLLVSIGVILFAIILMVIKKKLFIETLTPELPLQQQYIQQQYMAPSNKIITPVTTPATANKSKQKISYVSKLPIPPEKIVCPYCGGLLKASAKFCTHCGNAIEADAATLDKIIPLIKDLYELEKRVNELMLIKDNVTRESINKNQESILRASVELNEIKEGLNEFANKEGSFEVVRIKIANAINFIQTLEERLKRHQNYLQSVLKRFKTLDDIVQTYKKISIEKMAKYLEFDDPFSLEQWIVALHSSIFKIDGNDVIINTAAETRDSTVDDAIDQLLNRFQEFENTGYGKND